MKYVLIILAVVVGTTMSCHAQDLRLRFNEIVAQEHATPDSAFTAMVSLSEGGYPPALDRLGYYFRHGIGTDKDLVAARLWYMRAVAAGHPWSTASLARVEIKLEHGAAALRSLQTGVIKNQPGTLRLLATAHIDRQLGGASNPEFGRDLLEWMINDGDKTAARDLAVRVNWGRLMPPISDRAQAQIVKEGLAGDAKFAEAALVYLARHGGESAETVQTRALLANVPGIRPRVLSPERIRLAAIQSPRRFWSKVEEVLDDTETEDYARTASTAFWINKNSWVRVLQKELRALGYYKGRINGQMTFQTIKAQNRFCRDADIWNVCRTGPLRGPTVRAVAGAIAKHT